MKGYKMQLVKPYFRVSQYCVCTLKFAKNYAE